MNHHPKLWRHDEEEVEILFERWDVMVYSYGRQPSLQCLAVYDDDDLVEHSWDEDDGYVDDVDVDVDIDDDDDDDAVAASAHGRRM